MTDINGRAVINFIVMTRNLEALYTDTEKHTDDYLAKETAKIIERLGPPKVSRVMTDNASNNVNCWSILGAEYKETGLKCRGCAAHWLNLLVKDMSRITHSGKSLIMRPNW